MFLLPVENDSCERIQADQYFTILKFNSGVDYDFLRVSKHCHYTLFIYTYLYFNT